MRNGIVVIVAIFVLLSCASAFADFTVDEYEKEFKGSRPFDVYMKGLSRGITWYNVSVEIEHGKRLYCPPENLVLETVNYIRILDDCIAEMRKTGKLKGSEYIEMLLLLGLKTTFPCKR